VIVLVAVLAAVFLTLATLFAAWRTWRSGYVEGYKAGKLDGLDEMAQAIADTLPPN
jgi:hypothetical protein